MRRFQELARELNVVLPASVYETCGQRVLQHRRHHRCRRLAARHVSQGAHSGEPGYHEKFYFSPGDTGFKVWPTRFGTIGVAICWDQWFPESARAMAVQGAETPVLSDGHRRGAAGPAASIRAIIGSARCRGTPRPTSCRWSPPIASAPSRASAGK